MRREPRAQPTKSSTDKFVFLHFFAFVLSVQPFYLNTSFFKCKALGSILFFRGQPSLASRSGFPLFFLLLFGSRFSCQAFSQKNKDYLTNGYKLKVCKQFVFMGEN